MSYMASDLINFCLSKEGVDYVYGAWGQILTESMVDTWANSYPNMYDSKYIAKAKSKIGKPCTDCSGLISWFTGNRVSSGWFNSNAIKRIPISNIADCMPGSILWKSGHVGVYIGMRDGVPYDIEARGIDYGVITRPVSNVGWTYVLMMSDCVYDVPSGSTVDIDDVPVRTPDPTPEEQSDPESPDYMPDIDYEQGFIDSGNMLADICFQIGPAVKAFGYVDAVNNTNINNYKISFRVVGYGYMYDSVDEFTCEYDMFDRYQRLNDWNYVIAKIDGFLVVTDGVRNICNEFTNGSFKSDFSFNLQIGKDVEYIGDYAFHNTNVVNIISRSNVLNTLGAHCFDQCDKLVYADFNGTVTTVGEWCFYNDQLVTELNLSENLEYVPDRAFMGCYALKYFNKSNTVNSLYSFMGNSACFVNCNNIEMLTIPKSFEFDPSNYYGGYFRVRKNAGSNCNADGLQITYIYTNNPGALAYDWIGNDNRFPIFISGVEFLYVAHKGKWIKIKGYDEANGHMPVSHEDIYLWLKLVEQGNAEGTPVFVAHKGKWYQIAY